jgi:hypothetical protein
MDDLYSRAVFRWHLFDSLSQNCVDPALGRFQEEADLSEMATVRAKSNLQRRLQKLEAQLTDHSQLVPHTRRWLLYWTEQLGKLFTGEIDTMEPKMPLEAWSAVRDACQKGEIDSPYAEILWGKGLEPQ